MRAFAPGRVNLIGDHTDYSGGLALPMAIELGTTVSIAGGGESVTLTSGDSTASVALDIADPAAVIPEWGRYIAGVVAALRPVVGGVGTVSTTLAIGAGLASSAALEVAVALALGAPASPASGVAGLATLAALARLCQRAEHLASGVPCGIMDQVACVAGVAGHALLIDCATTTWEPVAVSGAFLVVHSGTPRTLVGSPYAQRRHEVLAAEAALGEPLRTASSASSIADPVLRRRARHVITENARVRAFVATADLRDAGTLMNESHASLRDDFAVSTAALDSLVERLRATPGVYGARLTGAGFGGCAVALVDPEFQPDGEGWLVHASDGARVLEA